MHPESIHDSNKPRKYHTIYLHQESLSKRLVFYNLTPTNGLFSQLVRLYFSSCGNKMVHIIFVGYDEVELRQEEAT